MLFMLFCGALGLARTYEYWLASSSITSYQNPLRAKLGGLFTECFQLDLQLLHNCDSRVLRLLPERFLMYVWATSLHQLGFQTLKLDL